MLPNREFIIFYCTASSIGFFFFIMIFYSSFFNNIILRTIKLKRSARIVVAVELISVGRGRDACPPVLWLLLYYYTIRVCRKKKNENKKYYARAIFYFFFFFFRKRKKKKKYIKRGAFRSIVMEISARIVLFAPSSSACPPTACHTLVIRRDAENV